MLISVKDAAERLFGTRDDAAYKRTLRFIKSGHVNTKRVGKKYLIPESELDILSHRSEELNSPISLIKETKIRDEFMCETKGNPDALANQAKWLQAAFDNSPGTKTKRAFAEFLGVTPETVSRYIHGKIWLKVDHAIAAFGFFGRGDLNELWGIAKSVDMPSEHAMSPDLKKTNKTEAELVQESIERLKSDISQLDGTPISKIEIKVKIEKSY